MSETKTSQEWFEELLPELSTIQQDQWAVISMPYEEAVAEGERMVVVSSEDREKLLAVGIDPAYIDSLDGRVGAFAYSVARADLYAHESSSLRQEWNEVKNEGYALCKRLLAAFEYAFYHDPNALKKLDRIRKGRGYKDMLNDLIALANINFDLELLNQARVYNQRLADLLAQKTIDPDKLDEYREMRMNDWTYLSEALSEIYRAGRYVFLNDPDRQELYYIDYYQKLRTPTESASEDEN